MPAFYDPPNGSFSLKFDSDSSFKNGIWDILIWSHHTIKIQQILCNMLLVTFLKCYKVLKERKVSFTNVQEMNELSCSRSFKDYACSASLKIFQFPKIWCSLLFNVEFVKLLGKIDSKNYLGIEIENNFASKRKYFVKLKKWLSSKFVSRFIALYVNIYCTADKNLLVYRQRDVRV